MYDPESMGMSHAEARATDPQQLMLLETGYEALCRTGETKASLLGSRTG